MTSFAIRAFYVPALLIFWIAGELTIFYAGAILGLQISINYALQWWQYYWIHQRQEKELQDGMPQIPPDYPTFVPIIGPLISILWDHGGFIRRLGQVDRSSPSSIFQFHFLRSKT